MKLSIAICDDNKFILDNEAKLIEATLLQKEITHTIDKFDNPLSFLNASNLYDIVFLDIEMDNLNGIVAAKKIREINSDCLIFFVTNHEAYLDEAFNQHAFRFWTKPIDKHKLIYGIESAVNELKSLKQTITINVGSNITQILTKNIIYIYVTRKMLHIVSVNGEFIVENTYKDIHDKLSVFGDFCEPCRGYYVNFKYVKNYTKDTLYCVYKDNTYKLDISRRKYHGFHISFVNWIGGKQ